METHFLPILEARSLQEVWFLVRPGGLVPSETSLGAQVTPSHCVFRWPFLCVSAWRELWRYQHYRVRAPYL